ncbi:MAG: FeoB-associated Cys-rich membrane protein [Candidatus Faecalibacterium intestinavium]|uniref:FeoB-associated Cys-rich membrane protein n=1 Tax=Candidatus Faecalibacterium intestinavium TaxID=2838580 RepID=A0A9E2NQ31_9FIRM|nr:FeoB-associated Cys-rich membrane protein [Candidatus Faecalibacterium intestinavium]
MLSLRAIITLIVLIGLFALAVVWISKNGGWKGEGCGGNCSACHERCENASNQKHEG